MSSEPNLLLLPPEEAVRRIARAQWAAVRVAATRLADDSDDEALHDVRVALRRLRSTFRTWKDLLRGSVRGKDRAALRDLQRATGAGRDAEVGAEWVAGARGHLPVRTRSGTRWLEQRLRKQSKDARPGVRSDVDAALERLGSRLEKRLSRYALEQSLDTPQAPRRFGTELGRALRAQAECLAEALAKVDGPADASEAHAARIEGKRLRYLIEVLPAPDDALELLKALQDLLGGLQDLDVLGQEIGAALEETAVRHARKLQRTARSEAAASARAQPEPHRSGLLALVREVEEQRRARFAELLSGWREASRLSDLLAAVGKLATACETHGRAGLEVERKYLLRSLPSPRPAGTVWEVEQGWLPGERLQERLRRVREGASVRCSRTVKTGRGVARTELEEACAAELFDALWPFTAGCRVTKRRHRIVEGERTWELDEFLDRDLVLAEIELAGADEEVVLPPWLAPFVVREVTEESAFVNRVLAH